MHYVLRDLQLHKIRLVHVVLTDIDLHSAVSRVRMGYVSWICFGPYEFVVS